ncbi:restriction endonuclease subunit S [Lentzea flava]|uniref:Type I restriction modification DNA specificity domain-containing protein n=1 Tax=Lentzea flava TaxID=103732 RepID=A0ABQ2UEG4_9PSEU|nr:restriction endonuclease subunit S [Lentzea flava]MCP2198549.1 type I restriction enzyme, S subunit [Lentzea flava]GGU26642.1 hypothetical protein GCM10010178_18790 [Lentzea flava]
MTVPEYKPLGQLLRRSPRYGINAAAVPLAPGVPTYIRITDIDNSGRFSPNPKVGVAHASAENYRLTDGELVFARTGASVGKSYLYDPRDGELVYAGFLINVAPDSKVLNPKYLSLFAQSKEYWDWVARTSVRSGQPGINGREYAQLPVPLPDIATQDAIAEAMTDVDREIDSLERILTKKRAIKQGMMHQLLTGKTRLSGFNEPLREATFGEVAEVVMGQSPVGSSYNRDRIGVPLINGPTEFTAHSPIPKQWTTAPVRFCEPGDILICVRGSSTGRMNVADTRYCIGRGVASVRASGDNDQKFVYYTLAAIVNDLLKLQTGSTFPSIDSRIIRSRTVLAPELHEQQGIGIALKSADDQLVALERMITKKRAIKQGMLQQLLTGRTRLLAKENAV